MIDKDCITTDAARWITAPQNVQGPLAAFYSPQHLSRVLAKWIVRDVKDTVLEPSFGGCQILECLAERYEQLGAPSPFDRISGCDVSQFAHSVLAERLPQSARENFVRQDFLSLRPGQHLPKVCGVIANPPYIGHHEFVGRGRRAIASAQAEYPVELSGVANLWAHFLLHSTRFLKRGGRLAFILPLSYMRADFARPVRSYLAKAFSYVISIEVGERLFEHASTRERVVVLLAEGFQQQPIRVISARCESVEQMEGLLSTAGDLKPTIANTSESLLEEVRRVAVTTPLGDLAQIRIGLVTGNSQFFISSRSEWHGRKVPARYLKPVIRSCREFNGIAVTSSDIKRAIASDKQNLLLCTSSSRNLAVASYLRSTLAQTTKKTATAQKRAPWYCLTPGPTPHAILPSLSHTGPRVYVLKTEVCATNAFYEAHFLNSAPCHVLQVAISVASSFCQLYGELASRSMSQGGFKLSLADTRKLPILLPSDLHKTEVLAAAREIDRRLRNQDAEGAQFVADNLVLRDLPQSMRGRIRDLKEIMFKERVAW